jgi:hypothetical protein
VLRADDCVDEFPLSLLPLAGAVVLSPVGAKVATVPDAEGGSPAFHFPVGRKVVEYGIRPMPPLQSSMFLSGLALALTSRPLARAQTVGPLELFVITAPVLAKQLPSEIEKAGTVTVSNDTIRPSGPRPRMRR